MQGMKKTDRGLSNKSLLDIFIELIRRTSSDLPVIVAMDSHGNSLHKIMYEKSEKVLKSLIWQSDE